MSKVVSAVVVVWLSFPASATTPYRVKDINTTWPADHFSSNAYPLAEVGNALVFEATETTSDNAKMWFTDGTESGTHSLGLPLTGVTVVWRDHLYIFQSSGAGTDIVDPSGNLTHIAFNWLGELVAGPDALYSRTAKWDGQSLQTQTLDRALPPNAVPVDYLGKTIVNAPQLMTIDGTHLTMSTYWPSGFGNDVPLVAGGFVYQISVGSGTTELWRADGTPGSAVRLATIPTNPSVSDNGAAIAAGSRIFFVTQGMLWTSDGTVEGTHHVMNGVSHQSFSTVPWIAAFGDRVVFSASNGTNGVEEWISDGTEAGTFMLKDVRKGADSSSPTWPVELEGHLYFVATTAAGERALYESDGTAASTTRISGPPLTNDVVYPVTRLIRAGARAYFSAGDTTSGAELWAVAPTPVSRFTIDDVRVQEGESAHFTVSLTHAANHRVTVQYETAGVTATPDADYTSASGTITFEAGETKKTIDIATFADSDDEHCEVFRVVLSNPSGATIFHAAGSALIEGMTPAVDLEVTSARLRPTSAGANPTVVIRNNGPEVADQITVTNSAAQTATNLAPIQPGAIFSWTAGQQLSLNGAYWWFSATSDQRDSNPANNFALGRYTMKSFGNVLSVTPAELHPGDTALLEISVSPQAASATSSNPAVLSVGTLSLESPAYATAKLTANAPGTATITAGAGEITITVLATGAEMRYDPAVAATFTPSALSQLGKPYPLTVALQTNLPFGLPAPTGTLSVYEGSTLRAVAPVTGTSSVVTFDPGGVFSHSLSIRYSGDAHYNPAAGTFNYLTLAKGTPSMELAMHALPNGQTEVIATVIGSPLMSPVGSISIDELPQQGSPTVIAVHAVREGVSEARRTMQLGAGIHIIRAAFLGDANYEPASITGTTAPKRRTSPH